MSWFYLQYVYSIKLNLTCELFFFIIIIIIITIIIIIIFYSWYRFPIPVLARSSNARSLLQIAFVISSSSLGLLLFFSFIWWFPFSNLFRPLPYISLDEHITSIFFLFCLIIVVLCPFIVSLLETYALPLK